MQRSIDCRGLSSRYRMQGAMIGSILAVASCSGKGSGNSVGSEEQSTGGRGATDGGAQGGSDASSPVVAPSTPVARNAGDLRGRLVLRRDGNSWNVYSVFDSSNGYQEYGFNCHLSIFDDCEVEKCAFPTGGVQGTLYNAGVLTLSDQTTGASKTLEPLAPPGQTTRAIYPTFATSDLGLNAGDHLHLSAAGSTDVAAFEADLVVPTRLQNAQSSTIISSVPEGSFVGGNGLGFTWTPIEGLAQVNFTYGPYGFSATDISFNSTAYCVYSTNSGRAGLSPSVIEHVGCSNNATAGLYDYDEVETTAGNYSVTVQIAEPNIVGWLNCVN